MKLRVIAFFLVALPALAQTPGQLTQERWNNLPKSPSVLTLREQGIAKRLPDVTTAINSSEIIVNGGDRYGIRLRGTVTPPVSGSYTFFVSGDDGTELLISPDSSSFGKLREAWSPVYSAPRQWDKFPSQRSRTLRLTAGQPYYVEALLTEEGGADHLSLGWSYEPDGLLASSAIGVPVTHTWTETAPGAWQATVDAGDIWNASDCFSFNCRDWSGDGEFTVRVNAMNNPHPWAKAGIMIRSSLAANSAHAMMIRSSANGMSFQRRRSSAASTSATTVTPGCEWVRLIRKGETITAHTSTDGQAWTQIGSDTFPGLPAALKVGLVATDTSPTGTAPLNASFSGADFKSLTAREVIPSAQLASYTAPVDDADGDSLPDSWETTHNLSTDPVIGAIGTNGPYADPDGDGISNGREYQLGTDPNDQEELASCLTRERWHNLAGDTIASLTSARNRFLREPDSRDWPSNAYEAAVGDNYGTRMRGFITAPNTGDYTFWISGDDEAELWLADGSAKNPLTAQPLTNRYGKQKIAWIRDERFGNNYTTLDDFDRYHTQRSLPVFLEAGELYYIEILHKEGLGSDHCAVAWQPPGQPRAFIPSSAFTADIPETDDADDDYLPLAWETQNGFNSADNGWTNATDGQYGDPDGDGLTNLEEFQLGTDPHLADTDGDGWNDREERDVYRTRPLISNAIQAGPLASIVLTSASATSVPWAHRPDGSAVAYERRGWAEYPIVVAPGEEGIYEISLTGGAEGGSVRSIEKLPISFKLDGIVLGRQTLICLTGQNTTLKQLTPWLTPGNHIIRVENHNVRADCNLRINALTIQRLGGPTLEGGTVPLWVSEKLNAENYFTRLPVSSRTSPACIEGISSWPVDIVAGTSNIPVEVGPDSIFYTNIPLDSVAPTGLTVSMQNGALVSEHDITWTRTNIMSEVGPVTIRKGDQLLITSHQGEVATGSFTLALTTNPGSMPPVAGAFSGHLPTNAALAPVAWPAADPALISAASGTMQGGWIPKATAATAYHIVSDPTGASFQLQFVDASFTKVAKVRVVNTANGLAVHQLYARYKSGNHLGQNFDTLAGTSTAPAGASGYGVTALSIRLRHALPITNAPLTQQGPQSADQPLAIPFDVPGSHTLTAIWTPEGGTPMPPKTLTVVVKTADFGPDLIVQTYNRRTWLVPQLSDLEIQPSSALAWVENTATSSLTRSFTVSAFQPGLHPVLARVPETGEIIARGHVYAFQVAEGQETGDSQYVEYLPGGGVRLRFTMTADELPPNGEIRLRTYYQGAVFGNGSRDLTLRASDFDENGIAHIFIEWAAPTGDPRTCHSVDVFLVASPNP